MNDQKKDKVLNFDYSGNQKTVKNIVFFSSIKM